MTVSSYFDLSCLVFCKGIQAVVTFSFLESYPVAILGHGGIA